VDDAREEFLHEVQYFSAISPRLGRRFDEAVRKAEALAAQFAEIGTPYKCGTRRVSSGKFKFSIVHLIRADEMVAAPSQQQQFDTMHAMR
jgi:hypothetical protein